MIKNCTIRINGYVYRVGFRTYAIMEAYKRGLKGEVRTTHRDQVQIEAEGEEEKLKEFIEWCKFGPPGCKVESIDLNWSDEIKGFTEFDSVR